MKKMEDEPTPTTPTLNEGLRAAIEKQQADACASHEATGLKGVAERLVISRCLYNRTILETALPSEEVKSTVRRPEETWLGIEVSPDDREKNWFGIPVIPVKREKNWFGIPVIPVKPSDQ